MEKIQQHQKKKFEIIKQRNDVAVQYSVKTKLDENLREYTSNIYARKTAQTYNKSGIPTTTMKSPNKQTQTMSGKNRKEKVLQHNEKKNKERLENERQELLKRLQNKELKTYEILQAKQQEHEEKCKRSWERKLEKDEDIRKVRLRDEQRRQQKLQEIKEKQKKSEALQEERRRKLEERKNEMNELREKGENDLREVDAIFKPGVNNNTITQVDNTFNYNKKLHKTISDYYKKKQEINKKNNIEEEDNDKKKGKNAENEEDKKSECKTEISKKCINWNKFNSEIEQKSKEEEDQEKKEQKKKQSETELRRIIDQLKQKDKDIKIQRHQKPEREIEIEQEKDIDNLENNGEEDNDIYEEDEYELSNLPSEEDPDKKLTMKEINKKVKEYEETLNCKFLEKVRAERSNEQNRTQKIKSTKLLSEKNKLETDYGKDRACAIEQLNKEKELISIQVAKYKEKLIKQNK